VFRIHEGGGRQVKHNERPTWEAVNAAEPGFVNFLGAQSPAYVHVYKATQAGGIDSLESIPGLL
jgi:hypothetical protein